MAKRIGERTLCYRNPFMEVQHVRVEFDEGSKDYFVVELGPRAGIIVLKDGHILLTKQYRFLIDDFSWELPGGRVEQGEEAAAAAVRECVEETGIRCCNLNELVTYYPGLDNFDNRTTLFWTESFIVEEQFKRDEREVVGISWVPLTECLEMIRRRAILDALTVNGILAYRCLV